MRMIVSLLRVSFQILARLGFMKITITSHHVSVSDSLKKFAEENAHIQRGVAAAERMYEVMGFEIGRAHV